MRACSRTRASASRPTFSSGGAIGSSSPARPRRVPTPLALSALRWRAAAPATRLRSSSARRRALHCGAQRHTAQCSTGSGYVPTGGYATGLAGIAADADRGLELPLHPAVVGHEVVHAAAVRGPRAAAQHDVQELRLPALDRRQLLHVGADLEDGRRLHVAGELGVRHLVVPGAERAVRLARLVIPAEQEVRVAAPGPVEERRLVDDVRAVAHGVERLGGGGPQLRAGVPAARASPSAAPGGATADPSFSISTTLRPAARRSSRYRRSCSRPRLATSSIEGSLRIGLATRPCIAARSRASRCPQARKPTRSVAAKTGRPSMSCIAGHRTGAACHLACHDGTAGVPVDSARGVAVAAPVDLRHRRPPAVAVGVARPAGRRRRR